MRPDPRHGDQASTCPPWCRRDHRPGDHPDDTLHQSDPARAVLVHGRPRLRPDDDPDPDPVVLRLVRREGSAAVWLEATSEEGRALDVLVSAESARRLAEAMTALLDLL